MNDSITLGSSWCRPSTATKVANCQTDKGNFHGFTHMYAHYLEPTRHHMRNLAEVGIASGGSIKMWLHYYPDANVLALDYNLMLHDLYREFPHHKMRYHQRLTVAKADQSKPGSLMRALGGARACLDMFVDDGGHMLDMQELTMAEVWPLIRPGGVLIMEDLHTSYEFAPRRNRELEAKRMEKQSWFDLRPHPDTPLAHLAAALKGESWTSKFIADTNAWSRDIDTAASTCGTRVNFYPGSSWPFPSSTALLRKRVDAKHANPSCQANK